jgi:hypothetical protein
VIGFDDIPAAKLITSADGKGKPSRIIVAERKANAPDEGTDQADDSPVDRPGDSEAGSGEGN